MIKYQYQANPKTNSLNPVQAVIRNKVAKNTVNFSNEMSYHFIFLTTFSNHLVKLIMFTSVSGMIKIVIKFPGVVLNTIWQLLKKD